MKILYFALFLFLIGCTNSETNVIEEPAIVLKDECQVIEFNGINKYYQVDDTIRISVANVRDEDLCLKVMLQVYFKGYWYHVDGWIEKPDSEYTPELEIKSGSSRLFTLPISWLEDKKEKSVQTTYKVKVRYRESHEEEWSGTCLSDEFKINI